jgi:hypothetical protein
MASNPLGERDNSPDPASPGGSGSCRRSRVDRRRRRVPPLRYLIEGRRLASRRLEDRRQPVLQDRYSPKLFAAIVGILFLSVMDAMLTLFLIEHGSTELNPVMGYFLQHGPFIFTVVKYLLTSAAVLVFLAVVHSVPSRWRLPARHLFSFALISFGMVVVWEIILIYLIFT